VATVEVHKVMAAWAASMASARSFRGLAPRLPLLSTPLQRLPSPLPLPMPPGPHRTRRVPIRGV